MDGKRNTCKVSVDNLYGKYPFADWGMDWRIILKWILRKQVQNVNWKLKAQNGNQKRAHVEIVMNHKQRLITHKTKWICKGKVSLHLSITLWRCIGEEGITNLGVNLYITDLYNILTVQGRRSKVLSRSAG